jgi:hypothetical protein
MAHHGRNPFKNEDQQRKKLIEELRNSAAEFCGALGDFPEGKLTKDDEGAIQFALFVRGGKVIIDFGTQVHWLGMTAQQAADLGSLLIKRAREAEALAVFEKRGTK